MKIVIDIPEKTNAHIRSDYGHGMKCLRDEDRDIVCDAIYAGEPYKQRPHGEWIPFEWSDNYSTKIPLPKGSDSYMEEYWDEEFICSVCGKEHHARNFCPNCGADMRTQNDRSWDTSERGVSGSVKNSITQKEGETE